MTQNKWPIISEWGHDDARYEHKFADIVPVMTSASMTR
jgi:hypothetical protein